ncbi:MAG: right-handed parallel beta-helix repeat-containing protein [Chloroflexota bacterium]
MRNSSPNRSTSPWRLSLAAALGLLVLFSLGLPPSARAAAITVCADGCDFTSLQAAIDSLLLTSGGEIEVRDAFLTEADIQVTKDVHIRGQGAQRTIIQAHAEPGQATRRVFSIAPGVQATLSNLTIRHGNPKREPESGGGIRNEGVLRLENVIVTRNSGSAGGGILSDGTLTLVNSLVSDNGSRGGADPFLECQTGGGIKLLSGAATLINTTVSGNQALGKGGGIHVNCESTLELVNSTISGNTTSESGGGIHLDGVAHLTHATISANTAHSGGGLYIRGTREKGVVRGELHITNTLIAGNHATLEKYGVIDCQLTELGSIAANSGNWIEDGNCAPAHSGDALLAPLSDLAQPGAAGSPESLALPVHALFPDSPAIDALPVEACAAQTDQLNTPRPQGKGCDIGAYEYPNASTFALIFSPTNLLVAAVLLLVLLAGAAFARYRKSKTG